MESFMIAIFVIGYLLIALEHPIKIDKAATAMITGVLCWTVYILMAKQVVIPEWFQAFTQAKGLPEQSAHEAMTHFIVEGQLLHYLGEIASILFFLLGAMTIVELVDAYEGFSIITDKIQTLKKVKLLLIVSLLTFFFSAVLDNLTTSIVMISLLRKLIADKKDRMFFAGMVIVAANAGGAWSPIGDVTTTMLWIGGQISAEKIIFTVIVPSIVCLAIPLVYLAFMLKGNVERPLMSKSGIHHKKINPTHKNIIFTTGVLGLLFVPLFKTVTHLPPFMGMIFSLGVIWTISEFLNRNADHDDKSSTNVIGVLKKIDTPSVLFFLGILVAITSLQATGILSNLAQHLDKLIGNEKIIVLAIGIVSAIVDNVPLVAAAQGMYSLAEFPMDHSFWQFLAYCAGTGGSCLIIGSAAGVAVMGMEKIDFIWYLKRISLLALLGYLSGAGAFVLQEMIIG